MTNIIDRMNREQLLIAAFYSTPIRNRFCEGSIPEGLSVAEECGEMLFGRVKLSALDDDGLRAHILKTQKYPTWRSDEAVINDDLLEAAYQRAIRSLAAKAAQ